MQLPLILRAALVACVTTSVSADPRSDAMLRLERPVAVLLHDAPLPEALDLLGILTGTPIQTPRDLPETVRITLRLDAMSLRDALDAVLDGVGDERDAWTWQVTPLGAIEAGPRSWLARHKRTEVYGIKDLVAVLPTYDQAATIDLQAALAPAQRGGGGGLVCFDGDPDPRADQRERAEDILSIITDFIEPDAWTVNGGIIASARIYDGRLLVRAPDFIHRQLRDHRPR